MVNHDGKQRIIELFKNNVLGKKANVTGFNSRHDGKAGHWLEQQMGVSANSSNTPDLFGYEMKNDTTSKTTFGDWSADTYIFKIEPSFNRNDFLKTFGKPNVRKGGRYSWSGEPCPVIQSYNRFGQILKIDGDLNIYAIYNYSEDRRANKNHIISTRMQINRLVLAVWRNESLRKKVEGKFNQNGWFKCLKNTQGEYSEIVFGKPIDYDTWVSAVRKGDIFFDSGMYETNLRNYSQWRANNTFWDSLITSRYS